jgi:hypothetical protein
MYSATGDGTDGLHDVKRFGSGVFLLSYLPESSPRRAPSV